MPISNSRRPRAEPPSPGTRFAFTRFRVPAFVALVLIVLALFGRAAFAATGSERDARASVSSAVPAALDCTQGSLSKSEAIDQLHQVRESIDRSLRLLDAGNRKAAFAEAKTGYLQCFEAVEAPLDVTAGADFRFEVEDAFARVRGLIESGAPTDEARDRIVTLRGLIDETERKLTAEGLGAPLIVFTQSFTILLREGLEAVLLLSVLLAYLDSTKSGAQYRKPILLGVGLALVATVATYFAVDAIFSVLPFGREVLEALVGLLAVAVLFYLSFWLLARMEQRRWLEFLKARIWTAVAAGSAVSLALIGFTSVFREGFETVLFYHAIFSFSQGLELWVFLGIAAAVLVLVGVAYAVLKLGSTIPMRTFLSFAVIVVMLTSVAVLGNAMRALQESAIISVHFLEGWPRLPIFLAQATGYYPTLPSVLAQAILLTIYALGAAYMFLIRPRRRGSKVRVGESEPGALSGAATVKG
jgi:high-affinity iron transporter